jgi:hypothetical protein
MTRNMAYSIATPSESLTPEALEQEAIARVQERLAPSATDTPKESKPRDAVGELMQHRPAQSTTFTERSVTDSTLHGSVH